MLRRKENLLGRQSRAQDVQGEVCLDNPSVVIDRMTDEKKRRALGDAFLLVTTLPDYCGWGDSGAGWLGNGVGCWFAGLSCCCSCCCCCCILCSSCSICSGVRPPGATWPGPALITSGVNPSLPGMPGCPGTSWFWFSVS